MQQLHNTQLLRNIDCLRFLGVKALQMIIDLVSFIKYYLFIAGLNNTL